MKCPFCEREVMKAVFEGKEVFVEDTLRKIETNPSRNVFDEEPKYRYEVSGVRVLHTCLRTHEKVPAYLGGVRG